MVHNSYKYLFQSTALWPHLSEEQGLVNCQLSILISA